MSTTHMKLIQPAHSAFQHPLLEYSAFHRPLRGLPPPCPYPRRPQRVSISSRAGLTCGESPPCDWGSTRSASTEPSPCVTPWQARCTASWRRGGGIVDHLWRAFPRGEGDLGTIWPHRLPREALVERSRRFVKGQNFDAVSVSWTYCELCSSSPS